MKANNYKLTIFGDQYSVVSDESQSQVNQAADMVDKLMQEISAKLSQVDEKRIAVLVALQMASKVLALEHQMETTTEFHKELAERIENECIAILRG